MKRYDSLSKRTHQVVSENLNQMFKRNCEVGVRAILLEFGFRLVGAVQNASDDWCTGRGMVGQNLRIRFKCVWLVGFSSCYRLWKYHLTSFPAALQSQNSPAYGSNTTRTALVSLFVISGL